MNELKKIIELKKLSVQSIRDQRLLLNQMDLSFFSGEILSLLGASGSGKTTLALTLMGLLSKNLKVSGEVAFLGESSSWIRGRDKCMIFQDPQVSLNPYFTIYFQLKEVLAIHLRMKSKEITPFLIQRLSEVGLQEPQRILKAYPHQLSGGEKQRVLIAMALLCDPKFLIADEPTASLDYLLKVQIIKLLLNLKEKRGFSLLLITHDIKLALKISERIVLIKEGQIIEDIHLRSTLKQVKKEPIETILSHYTR